jgi:hypothetical protein
LKVSSFFNLESYFIGEISLSHVPVIIGVNKKNEKYVAVANWPINTYGSSTGRAPIHVSTSQLATIVQNMNCARGLKEYLIFVL